MSFDVSLKLVLKATTLFLLSSYSLFAEDDVTIITADRIKSSIDKSSSDVRIITAKEINKSYLHTLPELLSKESDLSVASSGPSGSNSSLFLRGTDSSHNLVVIDGIVMNDPSNPNRQFDIGRLSLNNIEKIEILKGSQGLAYGSNAIGGVVVITTKKAKSSKVTGDSFVDYGSYNSINFGTNFQKKILPSLGISAGADFMTSKGFSSASENLNPNAEKDGNKKITLDLGAFLDISELYNIDSIFRYSHNKIDLDKGGGAGNDDPNDLQKEEELYSKIQLTKNWETGNAQSKLAYHFTNHYRLLEVLNDVKHPQSSTSKSTGEIKTVSLNHTYYINEMLTQNMNFDVAEESDQSKNYNRNISGFLYHQLELESDIFNFGLRLDQNKYTKDHFTYKLAAGHKFHSDLLKISYSTGFRAPSLNQLYAPDVGNKNLKSEKSKSLELSFEKNWTEHIKVISAIFYTLINNRFSYDPNNHFLNINSGDAEILGFENKISADWTASLNQVLSLTLLKAQDLSLAKKLARRPDVNLKNIFSYQIGNLHDVAYEMSYIGKRDDVDNSGATVKMNSYFLSNLNYRYSLSNQNDIYLKIKNLFNTDYEEIYGFGTGGRAVTAGATYHF